MYRHTLNVPFKDTEFKLKLFVVSSPAAVNGTYYVMDRFFFTRLGRNQLQSFLKVTEVVQIGFAS